MNTLLFLEFIVLFHWEKRNMKFEMYCQESLEEKLHLCEYEVNSEVRGWGNEFTDLK